MCACHCTPMKIPNIPHLAKYPSNRVKLNSKVADYNNKFNQLWLLINHGYIKILIHKRQIIYFYINSSAAVKIALTFPASNATSRQLPTSKVYNSFK